MSRHAAATAPTSVGRRGGMLIELLVVVVILGVLFVFAIQGLASFRNEAAMVACRSSVTAVATAAETYAATHQHFPESIAELRRAQYLVGSATRDDLLTYLPSPDGRGYTVSGITDDGTTCASQSST